MKDSSGRSVTGCTQRGVDVLGFAYIKVGNMFHSL